MLDEHFVILGALLNLVGSTKYTFETLKGRTKPNRVTWFLWALAPLIAFSAEISKGVGLTALMTFMVGFGPLLVLTASFINKNSAWEISRLDVVCGLLSILGIIFWAITREGTTAIYFSIVADLLAAIPTVIKAARFPETENYFIYLFGSISALITFLTIRTWDFANFGFPLYIFLICVLLVALVKFKLGKLFIK